MKLFKMGKDMKIKHSVSSPPRVWEDIFPQKAFHEGTKFLEQIYGGLFYTPDGKVSLMHFPII